MQSFVIVQTLRILARGLWYSEKIMEWIHEEDIKKVAQESHLPLLGWTLLIILLVSEALT